MTRNTGFVRNEALSAVIAVFTNLIAFTTFGIIVRIVPIVPITLPMAMRAGAIAATIKAILTIVSFISGESELSLSARA